MKKVLLSVCAVAFLATTLVSCKKDHTCTCTVDGITVSAVMADSKKKDAEDACSTLEKNYTANGIDGSCELE